MLTKELNDLTTHVGPGTPAGEFMRRYWQPVSISRVRKTPSTPPTFTRHDEILTAMRMMILKGIADVQKGIDPKHIIRDPEENEMLYLRGSDEREYFLSEWEQLAAAGRVS